MRNTQGFPPDPENLKSFKRDAATVDFVTY